MHGFPSPIDVETRIGDVLAKSKSSDMAPFTHTSKYKAVDVENWVAKTRYTFKSRHSAIARWFDISLQNARTAYDMYLSLSPLQRSAIRPDMEGFTRNDFVIESYMTGM